MCWILSKEHQGSTKKSHACLCTSNPCTRFYIFVRALSALLKICPSRRQSAFWTGRPRVVRETCQSPKIHILTEPALIDEKSIKGKAASYYKDSQEIFVNGLYPAVDRMSSELDAAMASIGDGEARREAILTTARRSMAFRVGKAVCYAISKRLVEEWTADDLERATSPEALSLMADDYRQGLVEAKRHATQVIRIKEASNLNTTLKGTARLNLLEMKG